MQDLIHFLSPINVAMISGDVEFTDGQLAKHIAVYDGSFPDWEHADIVIVGIGEMRGMGLEKEWSKAPNEVRKLLYQMHHWHSDIQIADFGNIQKGLLINDSYAALQAIVNEVVRLNKTIVIIGGSHDITLAQCNAYKTLGKSIEATCVDALIDLRGDSMLRSEHFLLDMLTGEPNIVKHYNHIGFQSFLVHPRLLETMDKLRFDCFRVGVVKDDIHEMEPVMRNTNLLSFDISAIKNSDAPANIKSPNGLTGEEACTLAQFAGMSSALSSFGIYHYDPQLDQHALTANQIAQMIWYFIDGRSKRKHEANINEASQFNTYHIQIADSDVVFLQSKKTGRWWMQFEDKKTIACSYKDYYAASQSDIPERWLRYLERNV